MLTSTEICTTKRNSCINIMRSNSIFDRTNRAEALRESSLHDLFNLGSGRSGSRNGSGGGSRKVGDCLQHGNVICLGRRKALNNSRSL